MLGQPDFTSAVRGSGAAQMRSPKGIWSDGTRLVVADASNGRVLVWNTFPTANGQPADFVVGLDQFGITGSFTAGAETLGLPTSVTSDGNTIYVTDALSRRVLLYRFPVSNGEAPIGVLGQTDFTLSVGDDPNQDGVSEGVVSARTFADDFGLSNLSWIDGALWVSDAGNARLLRFTPDS